MNVNERLFSKSSDALRIQIAQLVADIPSFIAKKDRKDRVVDTTLPVTSQQKAGRGSVSASVSVSGTSEASLAQNRLGSDPNPGTQERRP